MIPAMVAIAETCSTWRPSALFFNYGNPMSPVCRAIRKATGADVIGLCHGVVHVARFLAEQLGVEQTRFAGAAVGINHLTWFVEARVDGRGRHAQAARDRPAQTGAGVPGPEADRPVPDADEIEPPPDVEQRQPVQLAAARPVRRVPRRARPARDRVLPPPVRQAKALLRQDAWAIETRSASRAPSPAATASTRRCAKTLCAASRWPTTISSRISGEHEQVVDIIDSIRRDAGRVYSANLPNRGPGAQPARRTPWWNAPCIADGAGLRPIAQPPMAAGLAGTLATRFAWVETVVEAALEGSRDKFVQALLLDGSVDSLPTGDAAGRRSADRASRLPAAVQARLTAMRNAAAPAVYAAIADRNTGP